MELSGGKAEDIALGFKDGLGGIVNASRSLMAAYKSDRWKDEYSDEEYGKWARAEAIRMRDELIGTVPMRQNVAKGTDANELGGIKYAGTITI